MDEHDRLIALTQAEDRALALLDAIEAAGFIRPGRTEREVEKDIYALAERDFGVEVHWHKRIVRSGANTLAIFSDNPPILTIQADDIVFVDIGPVFEAWEADVGRTYAVGTDPVKHALVRDQPVIFERSRPGTTAIPKRRARNSMPWRSKNRSAAAGASPARLPATSSPNSLTLAYRARNSTAIFVRKTRRR